MQNKKCPLLMNDKSSTRMLMAISYKLIEASPQQATGNLPSKDFRLFLFRSLTPQQAARNALALLVQGFK